MDLPDAQDTAKRLRAIGDELSDRFYERADVVRTLIVTLPAGRHSLVLGPPGTAKSEMARELTGRFEGPTPSRSTRPGRRAARAAGAFPGRPGTGRAGGAGPAGRRGRGGGGG